MVQRGRSQKASARSHMKTMQALKVATLSFLALGTSYALGYLKGSGASHALAIMGRVALGAILLLILGVLAKFLVAVLLRRKGGGSPGSSGSGPRPPRSPVPRPGGGRPPSLSAAADITAASNA